MPTFRGTAFARTPGWTGLIWFGVVLAAVPAAAQSDNICSLGEAPDLIVGAVGESRYYGVVGGIAAYAFATDACNLGTCEANWIYDTPHHPVIAQNLYRLNGGRFEQIGQSWLKHSFAVFADVTCSDDCLPSIDDQHLGVACSDLYTSGLNGAQRALGRRSEVRALTGEFPWPPADIDLTGNAIYKRLQVHVEDLDPALNPGAQYWVEAHYVSRDDALAGNQNNNASIRWAEVEVQPDGSFHLSDGTGTLRETPAIQAWQLLDPTVRITTVDALGRYFVGAKVTDLGNGMWRYEYAIQNFNADGADAFAVRANAGSRISNIGFHDVDYHSGEPYDGTDWPGVFDPQAGTISWATVTPEEFTNALRWGTLYNFRFDADRPPVLGTATLDLFFVEALKSYTEVPVETWVPLACDGDGTCDPGEDCLACPDECVGIGTVGFCGDGVCDVTSGENCVSCSADCNGRQGGPQETRFCCGDGGGENPVPCTDLRCSASGFVCASPCCGDGFCDLGEGRCDCGGDCGAPAAVEVACEDGADDDCDGGLDCADLDCCSVADCADGIDGDGDSVAECDCDDTSAGVWARPGEARELRVAHDPGAGVSLLSWSPPVDIGATSVTYELLRSGVGSSFDGGASCLALADPSQPQATETAAPLAGAAFHYLVRAENACPAGLGLGPLGTDSAGVPRAGSTCP